MSSDEKDPHASEHAPTGDAHGGHPAPHEPAHADPAHHAPAHDGGHGDHGHADHGHADHGHADHGHADHGHADHGPEAHGHGHGDHGHVDQGHDGHAHTDHGHASHDAGHGHDDQGHGDHGHAPADPGHADHGHADHGAGAQGHGHDDHGHAPAAAAQAEAVHADPGHGDGDHGHGQAAQDHDTHGHDDHGQGGEAAAAAAGAAAVAAAVAASEPQSRPIWSDHGDAPFDDGEAPAARSRDRRKSGKSKKSKGGGGFFAELFDIVKTVVYALLIALVLRIVFFQPFTIPSASMEPNLYKGDYIVVSKWSYGYSRHSIPFSPRLFEGRILARQPERGDIVVFKYPRDNRTDYIKRVIGLPGDRVQMRQGVLHINDRPVETAVLRPGELANAMQAPGAQLVRETLPNGRSYVTQDFGRNYSDLDDTRVYVVPAGHYFMMGDNRDNSIDSRVDSGVGLVPEENLVGEAQIILFSWEPGVSLFNPVTWFTHARTNRFFIDLE